jgi:hypothetical protein
VTEPTGGTGLAGDEDARAQRLLDAQAKAADLFRAIEDRGLIAPGVRESAASDAIRDLAADMFGVSRHWHKRIVRAGPNTLQIAGDEVGSYIAPGSSEPMRRRDRTGRRCHWILEIHLVDRARQIGGFYEELLDLGHAPGARTR